MESVSDIKQETINGVEFEEHSEYVDFEDGPVMEKPENILVKSEFSDEEITPMLGIERDCEFEEFTQPDLILAADLNSILDVEPKILGDSTETRNDPNESCSKEDAGVPSEQVSLRKIVYNCEICRRDFATEIRKNLHMSTHFSKGPVQCPECGEPFEERIFYLQHYGTHFQYDCPSCDRKFASQTCLKIHQKSHSSTKTPSDATSLVSQKTFKCSYCPEEFPTRSELLGHKSLHNGRPTFQCQICRKNFGKQLELDMHERIHTGSRPFSCPVCAKTFVQKGSMKIHHKTAHSDGKKLQCELCLQYFSYSSSLKRHLRLHGGEKPHKCDQCDKRFQTRHALETHLSVHTGERPFSCSQCPRTFRRDYELKKHYRSHSQSQEAMPFQCGSCSKSFARGETLRRHQALHDDRLKASAQRKVERAAVKLSTKDASKLRRVGANERRDALLPFKCEKCDNRFAKKNYLRQHGVVHSDSTFACELCGKAFRTLRSLKLHANKPHDKVEIEVT